ncbi:hypothetical protein V8G54_032861 [Vigna mungo]|uniref:Uncharacterized protein n=1 Tax=Vigna mungo TaxID=3915 RepID=A0AAQ3MMY8_VIGMU
MCALAAVSVAALKTLHPGRSLSDFSFSGEFDFAPTDFTDSKEIPLDLSASSRSESQRSFVTALETSQASSGKSFTSVSISGGRFSSSTSSLSSKISAMDRFFGVFNFNRRIRCRSSLTLRTRQPSMCAFTAVSVAALKSLHTGQIISIFSCSSSTSSSSTSHPQLTNLSTFSDSLSSETTWLSRFSLPWSPPSPARLDLSPTNSSDHPLNLGTVIGGSQDSASQRLTPSAANGQHLKTSTALIFEV